MNEMFVDEIFYPILTTREVLILEKVSIKYRKVVPLRPGPVQVTWSQYQSYFFDFRRFSR